MDNTEEKIRQAAKNLFSEKGLHGTTIRDLATEAGVNVALLNYYFRSKEKLFLSIFEEMVSKYFELGVSTLLNREIPFEDRIEQYIEVTTALLLENQNLPMFILSEAHHDKELVEGVMKIKNIKFKNIVEKEESMLKEEYEKGVIRKISALQFDHILNSQIIFPFMAKPMVCYLHGFEDTSFEEFVHERKKIIKEMILKYLLLEG